MLELSDLQPVIGGTLIVLPVETEKGIRPF